MGKHFDAGLRALELDEGLPYLKAGALLGRARRELLGEELLIIGKAGTLSEPHEKGSRIDAASSSSSAAAARQTSMMRSAAGCVLDRNSSSIEWLNSLTR